MKSINKFYFAALIGALSIGAANATLITFDDMGFVALQDVTTQYAAQGVTFSGITDAGGPVNIEAADATLYNDVNPFSSPTVLSDFYGGSQLNRANIMQINFPSGASNVSFEYNPAGFDGVNTVFNVYNTSHTLINSFSDPAASGDGVWYLESINLANIGEVDIVNPASGWGHYIDNLSFSPVPEPSTLALAGLSVLSLLMFRRQRK